MTFEWDENKNLINQKKQDGISFEYAARVFLDSKRIETLDENYSEEEVADVLKKVNMYSVIEKFPKKLDTVFGENTNFSAGQLRRLSIARSLLFKPDFIFLDEPFSDLDIENQKILMTLFQELKNIMGIVIITHTYDFITENDNIIEVGDVNEK